MDLIGIEPMTSSMPFRRANQSQQTHKITERQREVAFMRGFRTFAASLLYLSNTERDGQSPVGMARL